MALYESTFIVRQDVSTQDVEKLTQHFSQILQDNGGKVVGNEYWGLRPLAYVIKKNTKGHYVMLTLDASPAAAAEMDRNLRIHEDILRNVRVAIDVVEKGPSLMLRNKAGDDERGERGERPYRDRDHSERGERSERPSYRDRDNNRENRE